MLIDDLRFVAAAARAARGPVLPRLAAPVPHVVRALGVRVRVARRRSSRARRPVEVIDLKQTDVVRSIGIVVLGIGVSTALVLHDALAAALRPVAVLRAIRVDVHIVRRCPAVA